MSTPSESRPEHLPEDEALIDDHPDEGMERFQRSGPEDDDLATVNEDESPGADEGGPDVPPPLTTPTDDRR